MIPGINAVPVTSVAIPVSHPWRMPENFVSEGYRQIAEVTPQNVPIFTQVSPVVHSTPNIEELIFYGGAPSEYFAFNDRMEEFQDQFADLQK